MNYSTKGASGCFAGVFIRFGRVTRVNFVSFIVVGREDWRILSEGEFWTFCSGGVRGVFS